MAVAVEMEWHVIRITLPATHDTPRGSDRPDTSQQHQHQPAPAPWHAPLAFAPSAWAAPPLFSSHSPGVYPQISCRTTPRSYWFSPLPPALPCLRQQRQQVSLSATSSRMRWCSKPRHQHCLARAHLRARSMPRLLAVRAPACAVRPQANGSWSFPDDLHLIPPSLALPSLSCTAVGRRRRWAPEAPRLSQPC
jgi:hypothetical protein